MTTTPTAAEYAAALHRLISMTDDGGSTANRISGLLLSLLIDTGHAVALGALLDNADAGTRRAVFTVLSGWTQHRWRSIPGTPDADQFIADMTARASA